MGNSFTCFSQRTVSRSKSSRTGTCHDFEHSDQLSVKALESLKRKSTLKNPKVSSRGSSYGNHLSTKKIIPDSVVKERENPERNGVIRLKMVLTKEEVTRLLSMLSRNQGDKAEQYVERIGWTPSLNTIQEENC